MTCLPKTPSPSFQEACPRRRPEQIDDRDQYPLVQDSSSDIALINVCVVKLVGLLPDIAYIRIQGAAEPCFETWSDSCCKFVIC